MYKLNASRNRQKTVIGNVFYNAGYIMMWTCLNYQSGYHCCLGIIIIIGIIYYWIIQLYTDYLFPYDNGEGGGLEVALTSKPSALGGLKKTPVL